MFGQSSGSMYEEIEKERARQKRKKQVLLRRIIAIIILSLLLVYLIILFIDTRRFKNGKLPLITTKEVTKEYDDGKVVTYYSLGWVFRFYDRETIKDQELVPFYRGIRLDNVLKRNNDPDLPEREKDYEIPYNPLNQEKVNNVLFFYKDEELLGTYACLLSENDCEISISEITEDDPKYSPKTKMGIIDDRYVFITEYKSKGTEAEEKYVYLYDIKAENYIAEYQGVRYTVIKNDKGYIDSSKYIIKKNNYWGIDQVIKGQVTNFEDYKYNYICYDSDSNLYILKNKDNKWLVLNANTKVYTNELEERINDVYYVNDRIYMITYEEDYSGKKNYKLYNQDAINVLEKNNIDNLTAYDNYLTYINDNELFIINYDGEELVEHIKLYLNEYQTNSKIKQYIISTKNNMLIVKVPKSTDSTHYVEEFYYDMDTWELKQKRNAQETISY